MGDFSKFKSVCVELLRAPSVENLNQLKTLVNECEDSLDLLQEYIMFPLYITASNPEIR